MPSPKHRSRKLRQVKKKLPGGRHTVHYVKRKKRKAVCGSCGKSLMGVSWSTAKTQKRPQRPLGGVLCFNCLQKVMMEKARAVSGE